MTEHPKKPTKDRKLKKRNKTSSRRVLDVSIISADTCGEETVVVEDSTVTTRDYAHENGQASKSSKTAKDSGKMKRKNTATNGSIPDASSSDIPEKSHPMAAVEESENGEPIKKKKKKNATESQSNETDDVVGKSKIFKDLMELLNKFKKEPKVKRYLTRRLEEQKIDIKIFKKAIGRWRQQRREAAAADIDDIPRMEGTLADVKEKVTTLVKAGGIDHKLGGELIQKWKRREHRRVNRLMKQAPTNLECLNCREGGHVMADCPKMKATTTEAADICFKCGSTEHNIYRCRRKNVKGFPFASCFVCGKKGHLSRECPSNSRGIYVYGGSCDRCGSKMHLRKNCDARAERREEPAGSSPIQPGSQVFVSKTGAASHRGGDEDDACFAFEESNEGDEGAKGRERKKFLPHHAKAPIF